MKARRMLLAGAGALALFAGCQPLEIKPPLVETVAVLPFDSESNDVNAPDIMQSLAYLALVNGPYRPSNVTEVNEFLKKVGIVDGGQLAAVDPVKLGKDLHVQALLFGYVESFQYTNIGFYVQRKVTVQLKMVDVATGQTLWENTGTGVNRKFATSSEEAQNNLVGGLADQLIDKLFKSPLEEEARLATVKALSTLPGWRFTGFANDDKTRRNAGIKNAIKSTTIK